MYVRVQPDEVLNNKQACLFWEKYIYIVCMRVWRCVYVYLSVFLCTAETGERVGARLTSSSTG